MSKTEDGVRRPTSVNVIRVVDIDDARKTEVCFGKLKPRRLNRLSFGKPGQVQAVLKSVDDVCAKGEQIATLAQRQLETQRQQLQGQLEKLKRDLQVVQQAAAGSISQQIRSTESALQDVDRQLAAGIITAPYDCIVTLQGVDEKMMVSSAVTAFTVVENASPIVEASLPAAVAAQLTDDQVVWVGIGERAIVARMVTETAVEDVAKNQRIVLEFQEELPDDKWSFGQVVEIRFFARTNASGFWVPVSALSQRSTDSWSVFAVESLDTSTVQPLTVDVIHLEGDFALVSGLLANIDHIVADGSHRIVAGQTVTAVDVSEKFRLPFASGAAE